MAESAIRAAIDEGNAKFEKFWESGDMKSLSELYTEDCKLLVPGMETQNGRKAVEKVIESMKAAGFAKIRITSDDKAGFGEFAYDCGRYTLFKDDGTVSDRGNSLVVWKKVGGTYYMYRDCFNSSASGEDTKP